MKRSSYLVLVVFAVVVAAVWWLRQEAPSQPATSNSLIEEQTIQAESTRAAPAQTGVASETPMPTEDKPEAANNEENANCLNLVHISLEDQHPIMIDEAERLAPILITGPQAEAYRDQSKGALESLASAGDSMAMAMLGAEEMIEAFGDGENAVEWLEEPRMRRLYSQGSRERRTAKQIDLLDRAAYWFQEAALHGRLSALQPYAQVMSARFGGAEELGWISAEELDEFPNLRSDAAPDKIYLALMFELQPELKQGLIGAAIGKEIGIRQSGREYEIIDKIIDEQKRLFLKDRDERGLQAAQLPPSRYSEEEIRRSICQTGD